MTKCFPRRILKGNRVAIPEEIMKNLNLKVGDWLLRDYKDGKITFTPAIIISRTTFHSKDDAS